MFNDFIDIVRKISGNKKPITLQEPKFICIAKYSQDKIVNIPSYMRS
jgi:hypothetical protein